MRKPTSILIMIILAMFLLPTISFAKDAEGDLKQLNMNITKAIAFVEKDDLKSGEAAFTEFRTKWFDIEDGIKEKSTDAYRDIEATMGEIQFAFLKETKDKITILNAMKKLDQQNNSFIQGDLSSFKPAVVSNNNEKPTVVSLIALLEQAIADIKNNQAQAAKDKVQQFRESWLDVEGVIVTQSSKVYTAAESDMVISYSQLSENPVDMAGAEETLTKMRDYLIPLSTKTSYTMIDAVTIILREGLEALLVIVALLGFLKKSGHQNKEKWIWSGVGFGVIVSMILGVVVQMLFSSGAFGSNNFLIAGFTGLFAAVMLVYMSYWLHSKSSLAQWSQYISNKSTKALASGSLWSLAVLAFLAVFREGTEMVLFFIGMASSISLTSLLTGIGLGILILAVISYLILKVGLKIPMRPFFLISSIFVFYLCFKFLGMGVHGLQLAGVLQATRVASMPTIEFFALYATWENVVPQAFLLVLAAVIVIWSKQKDLKLRRQMLVQQKSN
ncbi:FTR1 family iron permease [Paenibacillus psychroresistens]|uniref:FTR1 family iron permease n=1 Tax=Paenibacillus psychroresistens TaxID=1778678 RepID=A0A6B8RP57_9BACL|nr:FTR1 family protein [Paenibacillus psychroresistens]QGQ97472.1 FTR1 family iron permease [Paenibacillus psychroresistens]